MKKIINILLVGIFFVGSSVANGQSFLSDISGYEFEESIDFLYEGQVLDGYPDGTFRPNDKINRAEFTKVVMNSLYDIPDLDLYRDDCFLDVKAEDWFSPYVCLAKEEGIISGYPDGTFKPADNINQAEVLKIIYEGFYDEVLDIGGEWFQKYLDSAEYAGMFYFAVNDNPGAYEISRGEVSYFLAWLLDINYTLSDQILPRDFYGEDVLFGWEALSADECRPNEVFVEEDQYCYLESSVEGVDFSEGGVFDFDDEFFEEDSVRIEYTINGDEIVVKNDYSDGAVELQNTNEQFAVWDRFVELIPSEERDKIVEYWVFNNSESTTMAYVMPFSTDGLDEWIMAINLYDVFEGEDLKYEGELDHTLIHEFAHVLTLDDEQIDSEITLEECTLNYFPGEGCSRDGSFINRFVKRFWNDQMLETVERDENAYSIYDQKPDLFVTDYAATNPAEDIAETFTMFVLRPEPTCGPRSLISDQKICMFYEYPTLKDLRLEIREDL